MKEKPLTTYYLMVSDTKQNAKILTDKIRRVETSSKKAREAAQAYERELNGGKTVWEMQDDRSIMEAEACYLVTEIPWSVAREYTSFRDWPCNQEA